MTTVKAVRITQPPAPVLTMCDSPLHRHSYTGRKPGEVCGAVGAVPCVGVLVQVWEVRER